MGVELSQGRVTRVEAQCAQYRKDVFESGLQLLAHVAGDKKEMKKVNGALNRICGDIEQIAIEIRASPDLPLDEECSRKIGIIEDEGALYDKVNVILRGKGTGGCGYGSKKERRA